MAENPSYNSSHPKWRGTELADLDCGYGIKAVAARSPFKTGSFIAATGRGLGGGGGGSLLGGELYWERTAAGTCVPTTVLAVGDPYCCARLIGPVNTLYQKGIMLAALQQQWAAGRRSPAGAAGGGPEPPGGGGGAPRARAPATEARCAGSSFVTTPGP